MTNTMTTPMNRRMTMPTKKTATKPTKKTATKPTKKTAAKPTKKTATKKTSANLPVIVTTEHRGVFFGYTATTEGDAITLAQCRMCLYWDNSLRGVLGLGSAGPSEACRISQPVALMELRAVTAVISVSPAAAARWEAAPWG